MFKKINHFYRHCPHCRTGILILVTILLTIGSALIVYYNNNAFIGQILNVREERRGNELANEVAKIVAPRGSRGFAFCSSLDPVIGFFDWCKRSDGMGFSSSWPWFAKLLGDQSYDWDTRRDLLISPHLYDEFGDLIHENNLDLAAWSDFILTFMRRMIDPQYQFLYLVAHGSSRAIELVQWPVPWDGRLEEFMKNLLSKLVSDGEDIARELGVTSIEPFFELTWSHRLKLKKEFFDTVPLEKQKSFVVSISCHAGGIIPGRVVLGYPQGGPTGCGVVGFSFRDAEKIFKRLDAIERTDERTVKKSYEAGGFSTFIKLVHPTFTEDDRSFSPAPYEYWYHCRIPPTDNYAFTVFFDTEMNTNPDKIRFGNISGNLRYPNLTYWSDQNTLVTLGGCDGVCRGSLTLEEAYGSGNGENYLNGNSWPPNEKNSWGKEQNYILGKPEGHDPFLLETDCSGTKSDGGKSDGEGKNSRRKNRPPPPPPQPPPVCGNGIPEGGEECGEPGLPDCPYIPGCGAPEYACVQCQCVLVEHGSKEEACAPPEEPD